MKLIQNSKSESFCKEDSWTSNEAIVDNKGNILIVCASNNPELRGFVDCDVGYPLFRDTPARVETWKGFSEWFSREFYPRKVVRFVGSIKLEITEM